MADAEMIVDRVPVVTVGTVLANDDPQKLGRIKVSLYEMGIEKSGWIYRSAIARDHRVPRRGVQVLLNGYLSGTSLTLFFLGVIHTQKNTGPGRGLLGLSAQEYADSVFSDFGGTEDTPNEGVLLYYDAKEKTFTIRSKGGSAAQIVIDDDADTITLIPGGGDIQIGEDPGGARLSMVGDTVVVDGVPGTITGGSVPMTADFPR